MKQDQHCQGNKRIKSSSIQSRAIIGQNNSIVSGTNNAKNQQDHDRAQSTQSSAELEHVPRHRSSRSMHTQQTHHDSAPKLVTFPSFKVTPQAKRDPNVMKNHQFPRGNNMAMLRHDNLGEGKRSVFLRREVRAWSAGSLNLGFMEKNWVGKGGF